MFWKIDAVTNDDRNDEGGAARLADRKASGAGGGAWMRAGRPVQTAMRRWTAMFVALLMVLGMLQPLSFAVNIGNTDQGQPIQLDEVRFSLNHEVFQFQGGYLELFGENLKGVDVFVEIAGQGLLPFGKRTVDTPTFVKIDLNKKDIEDFNGMVRIGSKNFNLNTSGFPNIQGSNRQTVIKGAGQSIQFHGSDLNKLNQGDIKGRFGAGLNDASLGTTANPTSLTLTDPQNPGRLGYQNIVLSRETVANASQPKIQVRYLYQNAFRIIENLGAGEITMYPNTGAKNDELFIVSNTLSNTKNYVVYFLKTIDGSDKPSEVNRAGQVSLGIDVEGQKDVLTVKVPNHAKFQPGTYFVLLTDVQNGQVVAEQFVKTGGGAYDQFTVIQAGYNPSIVSVYPDKGPDTGSNVEIKANYVLSLNIPDLEGSGNFSTATPPSISPNGQELRLTYENGTYKGEAVTITRTIGMQIGKKVKFATTGTAPTIEKGYPDKIMVRTQVVDDAEVQPRRDVIIEMTTTLQVVGNPAKKYVFNQLVSLPNGYEYEPSTFTPEIESVTPDIVQLEQVAGDFLRMKEEVLFSIKGGKFLVDRVVEADGTVITRMPSVFIKKDDGNTQESKYQVAILPNAETKIGGVSYRGLIYYRADENTGAPVLLLGADGKPVTLEMVVLDKSGNLVDGTTGNQIGTNIVFKLPNNALIKDAGIKHIQVTNPVRKSEAFGKSSIVSDIIEFIITADTPVIEKVVPNIITVQGGDEITIIGANITAGARLFLDGNEIKNFSRELDPTGNRIIIKFKAPKGREGLTQLMLQNPSGGMAVADFTYVNSFEKNPRFDSFTPEKGTYGTIVVIDGENFLKPDPTAVTERGIDAFKLIGTRVQIDGRDVDTYNKDTTGRIVFKNYTVPNAEALLRVDAGNAAFSKLSSNVTVKDANGKVVVLGLDGAGNPAFRTAEQSYSISWVGGAYKAFLADGTEAGAATVTFQASGSDPKIGTTVVKIAGTVGGAGGAGAVDPQTFTAVMNNHLFRQGTDAEGEERVFISDYAESITLKDGLNPPTRYTLSYNFKNEAILTNGKDQTYTIVLKRDGSGAVIGIAAFDSLGNEKPITATATGVTFDGKPLQMITPYEATNGIITGNLTKVLSRTQILFEVPQLTTGKGFKDLVIINPDTKSDAKLGQKGFYYIDQATSKPVISTVKPNKGSVDGGYYVTITGSQFEDDARVFIDSTEVPKADTFVSLDGTSIVIKMPKSKKKLNTDFGVDQLAVPVVVLNPDGGSAGLEDGFIYMIPNSAPVITRIVPADGSSNGNEVVEITGYEFRYYEPYKNIVGNSDYQVGDKFQDLFVNGKWDNLLGEHDPLSIEKRDLHGNLYYDKYYVSPVLPKVYFGEAEAKIVEFTRGYLKVITPAHVPGKVDVYVINNDSGVSNKVTYTYKATTPVIDQVIPNIGRRGGQEPKELFGSKMYRSIIRGYVDNQHDLVTPIQIISDVEAIVRFGEIDNTKVPRTEPNSGLINNQRTTVKLDGGLTLQYYGDQDKFKLSIEERNKIFAREFLYDNSEVYVPIGMLRTTSGEYYIPSGLTDFTEYTANPNTYKQPYEYVKVYVNDRRVFVERGYAPKVVYESDAHVTVYTPQYHTIGQVKMLYTNPDKGTVSKQFTFTNPASVPKILKIEPQVLNFEKTQWLVESSVDGGIDIEIIGLDLRPNLSVTVGDKKATVKELTTKTIDGKKYDVAVVTVPKGTPAEIGKLYPIIVENEDKGIATSNNIKDLIGPNHEGKTLPFYFVYRKPLSFPKVEKVTPKKTSIAGGNTVVITGSDFRKGAYIIIGTRAGIPIYTGTISNLGKTFTFKTPTNMTLGAKDIQVLNSDYGTGLLKNALTVVSAPTVNGQVLDEKGEAINRIHVTGGQKIQIKGTSFQKGASVYFGGEWIKVPNPNPDNENGPDEGIYRDDVMYFVKDGVKAKSVEWKDENTLVVTTPEVKKEGAVSIVVLNPDGGITDNKASLEYRVPIPSDPRNLRVTLVDNKYIKLHDYVSKDAKYFEIYAYIGAKNNAQLMSNEHKDFLYLGVTEVEPYKIIELPGWERMKAGDRAVFVVKGVNKFGQSGWSNFAALSYQDLKDVKQLGPDDLDGEIGVPKGKDYVVETKKGELAVVFAGTLKNLAQNLDLTTHASYGTTQYRVSVPEALIRGGAAALNVVFGGSAVHLTPAAMRTSEFRAMDAYYDAYGNFRDVVGVKTPTPAIRGWKAVGQVHSISFDISSNEQTKGVARLANPIEYGIKIPEGTKNPAKVKMYRWDQASAKYLPLESRYDAKIGYVFVKIERGGYYVLMVPQR